MKSSQLFKWMFVLLYCCVVMNSCRKDSINGRDGESVVRFTFNGEQIEYSSGAFGNISENDGMKTMVIGAYKNFSVASALKEHISLIVYSNTAITAGANYHDPIKVSTTNGTKMPQVIITHYNKAETGFQTVGIMSDENGVVMGSDLIPSLKNIAVDANVTVTELTNTRIKGRFSGTAYQADSWTDGKKFPITNGEFSVVRE
ncbi:MAG TPA: hypothetical protein PKV73_15910 [Agriterribacter sp.]|nr:hypothetical protein [Agriterribacter sp.]